MKKTILLIAVLLQCFSGHAQSEEFGMGLLPDDGQYDLLPCKATLNRQDYQGLPSNYSLRQYCPDPMSQKGYGTCTGWATAYAARTIAEAVRLKLTDRATITKEAFSPLFVYALIKEVHNDNCSNGSQVYKALQLMKHLGCVKKEHFNTLCADNVPQRLKDIAKLYKIDDFFPLFNRLSPVSITKIQKVKKAISQENPVVISMETPTSFHKAGLIWNGEDSSRRGRHALCVVGYDDGVAGGAFLIMNSWGKQWGDQGFTWIKYSDFEKYVYQAYELYVKKMDRNDLIQLPRTNSPKKIPGGVKIKLAGGAYVGSVYNQTLQTYTPARQIRQGSRFSIELTNDAPSYIYVLGIDANGRVSRLFPASDNISAAVTYRNSHLTIPGENDYLTKGSGTSGIKRLCVFYSKEELDFDQLISNMKLNSARSNLQLSSDVVPVTIDL